MTSRYARLWQHASTGQRHARQKFSAETMSVIEQAVRACESQHAGEVRFALEHALPLAHVWRGLTARARAVEVFSQLRVWDTEHNNGVLIYLLLADRAVEIVADRGVARELVPQAEWDAVCRLMEQHFRTGDFRAGALAGIDAVAQVLAKYPPRYPDVGNELPDAPVLLG